MTAVFSDAKNGELTCSFDGKFLHSRYNPSNEAEKFVQNIEADFIPLAIVIIEGGLSYCVPYLRKKFPNAVLCTVRFSQEFKKYDNLWDFVFYADKDTNSSFQDDIFNALGEEKLSSSLFFDWTPAKNIFNEKNAEIWLMLKNAVLKSRDVLGTRAYFSKRWIKNAVIFAANIRNGVLIKKTDAPILITASGPSLKDSLPFIKKYRDRFILMAVSSSYTTLIHNKIMPDLVISSDGGYWAKKHLDFPGKKSDKNSIVFALEGEAAIPKELFETCRIIPLCYEDGVEKQLFESIGCPFMLSRRNGTISGTALEFALNLTSDKVFFCGLDQEPAKGYQHTQPNTLEKLSETSDFRLKPKETRLSASQFSSEGSLSLYRNWFISVSPKISKRVFRLSDKHKYTFTLGQIRDINWTSFEKMTESEKTFHAEFENFSVTTAKITRKKEILKTLEFLSGNGAIKNELFPLETLLIQREKGSEKKASLQASLEEKIKTFIEKSIRLL